MSVNYYSLERLSARYRVEIAAEAHRDHVGAALVRETEQRRARIRRMVELIDASFTVIQRALRSQAESAATLAETGKKKAGAN